MAIYEEFEIEQGATFRYKLNLKEDDESPYNIADFTIAGQIRRNYKSSTVAATFTAVSLNPGEILLTLTDEQTAALTEKRYVFDVLIESPIGERFRVIEGIVTVSPAVTQI